MPGSLPSGDTNEIPGGLSDGNQNGFSDQVPNGVRALPTAYDTAGISVDSSSLVSLSEALTCAYIETTTATVFVTIFPSRSVVPPGASMSSAAGADNTAGWAPMSAAPFSSVAPFTTISIDIWGSGPSSGAAISSPTSVSAVIPSTSISGMLPGTNSISPFSVISEGIPQGTLATASSSPPYPGIPAAPPTYGTGAFPNLQGSSALGLTVPQSQVVPMESSLTGVGAFPFGTPPNGMSFAQGLPAYTGGPELPAFTVTGSNGQLTIVGSDGKPTILGPIIMPTRVSGQAVASSLSDILSPGTIMTSGATIGASAAAGVTFPPGTAEAESITCTTYTEIGPNGLPTVTETSWIVSAASLVSGVSMGAQITQLSVTSASFMSPATVEPESITCTTYTAIRANGLPTVMETSWLVPAASSTTGIWMGAPVSQISYPSTSLENTATGPTLPTELAPNSASIQPQSSSGGELTCVSITIIGPDGVSTVMESTFIVPPTPLFEPTTGIPTSSSASEQAGVTTQPSFVTCVTYTETGVDGSATVLESMLTLPITTFAPSRLPVTPAEAPSEVFSDSLSGQITSAPTATYISSPPLSSPAGIVEKTSLTITGPAGIPVVIDTTVFVTDSFLTQSWPPSYSSLFPGGMDTEAPLWMSSVEGITTESSYTGIGSDGQPIVVETTMVLPEPSGLQTAIPGLLSPASSVQPTGAFPVSPAQETPFPGYPPQPDSFLPDDDLITICVSYTSIGPNGEATVIESASTIVASAALGVTATIPSPTAVFGPSATNVIVSPQDVTPIPSPVFNSPITTCTTETVVGLNGEATPTIETIVLPSGVVPNAISSSSALAETAGLPAPPPSIPVVSSNVLGATTQVIPPLSAYGSPAIFPASVTAIMPFAQASSAGAVFAPGTMTGTFTLTSTVVVPSDISLVTASSGLPLPFYGEPSGVDFPSPVVSEVSNFPGAESQPGMSNWPTIEYGLPTASATREAMSPCTTTTMQPSTWVDVLPDDTTTYTFDFPLTTLATVRLPMLNAAGRRLVRRQGR